MFWIWLFSNSDNFFGLGCPSWMEDVGSKYWRYTIMWFLTILFLFNFRTDVFTFSSDYLGKINMIRFRHDGKKRNPEWHVDKVIVYSYQVMVTTQTFKSGYILLENAKIHFSQIDFDCGIYWQFYFLNFFYLNSHLLPICWKTKKKIASRHELRWSQRSMLTIESRILGVIGYP